MKMKKYCKEAMGILVALFLIVAFSCTAWAETQEEAVYIEMEENTVGESSAYDYALCVGGDFQIKMSSRINQNYNFYCSDTAAVSNVRLISTSTIMTSGGIQYEKVYALHAAKAYEGTIDIRGVISGSSSVTILIREHKWAEEATIDKAPTCTESGKQSIHCEYCDQINSSTIESIQATGHAWDEGVVTKEATCVQTGIKSFTCINCKTTKNEEIPVAEHVWDKTAKIDRAPTCTESGSESIHCSVCNTSKPDSEKEIDALGHSWDDSYTVDLEPTCTESGLESIHCSVCSISKPGSEKEIDALEHTWNDFYTVDLEPTCNSKGSQSKHCSVCDTINPDTVEDVVPIKHTWTDWNVLSPSTIVEYGEKERSCTVCGHYETQKIYKAKPQLVSATAKANKYIRIKWAYVDGAEGYYIYRKTENTAYKRIGKIENANVKSYTDKTAKLGTKYTYSVGAYCTVDGKRVKGTYDKNGVSAMIPLVAPYVDNCLRSPGQLTISWEPVKKADGYYLFRRTNNSKWRVIKKIKSPNITKYTEKKAMLGIHYFYALKAYCAGEDGTVVSSMTEPAMEAHIAIMRPRKLKTQVQYGKRIKFSWEKVDRIQGYIVYRKTGDGAWEKIKEIKKADKTFLIDRTAEPGVEYTYTVRAYVRDGKKLRISGRYKKGVSAMIEE